MAIFGISMPIIGIFRDFEKFSVCASLITSKERVKLRFYSFLSIRSTFKNPARNFWKLTVTTVYSLSVFEKRVFLKSAPKPRQTKHTHTHTPLTCNTTAKTAFIFVWVARLRYVRVKRDPSSLWHARVVVSSSGSQNVGNKSTNQGANI